MRARTEGDVAEQKLTDMAMRLDAPDTARASPASCPHPDVGVLKGCKNVLQTVGLWRQSWVVSTIWQDSRSRQQRKTCYTPFSQSP